jgi:predicted permease
MQLLLWLERFWQDVRHGLRVFARSPGFTAVAILSIACGTGANVAIFSVADALLLRPLPAARPDELLVIGSRVNQGRFTNTAASYPDYLDFREQIDGFDGMVASTLRPSGISFRAGAPTQVKLLQLVSANFFDVLEVPPVLGRGFLAEEERVPGRDAVAVLSYGVWQQQYGGDAAILGRTLRIGGVEFTIVGVAPERFTGLETRHLPEIVYVPLAMAPALGDVAIERLLSARDLRILTVRGRLRRGAVIRSVRGELTALGRNLQRAYPDTNRNQVVIGQTELESRVTTEFIDAALVLLLTILSTAVLVVACANVAGLLASRASLRMREISLRLAIGASRARLVRQLVTESLMLAAAGGVCGLAVGYAGIALVQQIEYPSEMVALPVMELDRRALIFSLLVAMTSAFLFGVGPALQTTRVDLAGTIKASDTVPRRRRLTARQNLVAVQVALSLVLVTIAAVTVQVFHRIASDGPGFRTTQIAKVSVDTAYRRYDDRRATVLFERAVEAARRLPAVTSAALTSEMPFWGIETAPIVPDGYQPIDGQPGIRPIAASVSEDYFAIMGIAIVDGRTFHATDDADAARVAIVNETLARRYWPGRSAVGGRFRLGVDGSSVEVIGVARDSKYFYIVEPPQEALYFPFRQEPRAGMVLLARTAGPSADAVGPLRDLMVDLDPDLPVYDAQTIETFYAARATGFLMAGTEMVGGLGAMGTGLTMVGLYALVSYSVNRRIREIGIRMAIGATHSHITSMIVRQGMRPAWVGLPIGLLLSVMTTQALPAIVPADEKNDPGLFVLVMAILLGVVFVAAFIPARRAARVNPTIALRCE